MGTDYIEWSRVARDGGSMTYWILTVASPPNPFPFMDKTLCKVEVMLNTPRKVRNLECYFFDSKGIETSRKTEPVQFWTGIEAGSPFDKMLDTALTFAKKGKDSGQKPALLP
jgi:hypothetical protein